jgi:hypothetical protein
MKNVQVTWAYSVNPVFALIVINAPVQSVGCEDEEKTTGLSYALQKVVVEFPSLQSFHIDKDRKTSELKVNLEKTSQLGPV